MVGMYYYNSIWKVGASHSWIFSWHVALLLSSYESVFGGT